MNLSRIAILLLFSIVFFLSCGQQDAVPIGKLNSDTSNNTAPLESNQPYDTSQWLTPKSLTPFSFLEVMRQNENVADKLGVIVMADSFPDNWLKQGDIDSLIKLVNSTEKCNCFLNPNSSYIPHDSADIGGYAIALITAFRERKNVSFGLYACPKTSKKDANAIIKWWTQQMEE